MRKRFTVFGWATSVVALLVVIGFVASCGEASRLQPMGISGDSPVLKRASSWDIQQVDTYGDTGYYTSIDFDSDGEPAIALS